VAAARRLLSTIACQKVSSAKTRRPKRVNLLACTSVVLGLAVVGKSLLLLFGIDVTPIAALGVLLGCLAFHRASSASKARLPAAALLISVAALGLSALPSELVKDRIPGHGSSANDLLRPIGSSRSERKPHVSSEHEWTLAPEPACCRDMQVRIVAADVLVDGPNGSRPAAAGSARLTFTLDVKNASENRVYHYYKDWSIMKVRAHDNFKNSYSPLPHATGAVDCDEVPDSLYPGKSYQTAFSFEAPVEKVQDLYLELPADCIGSEAPVRFRIPADLIHYQPDRGTEETSRAAQQTTQPEVAQPAARVVPGLKTAG